MVVPWLDFLLAGFTTWGAISGYLVGFRRALARLCVSTCGLLVTLPLARNCATHLSPVLEPLFSAVTHDLAVSAGAIPTTLGPWRDVLTAELVSGNSLTLFTRLAINIASLCFLAVTLLIVGRLTEKPKANAPSPGGLAVGLVAGFFAVITFLALTPVLLFGKGGAVLAMAVQDSGLATLFSPLVRAFVNIIAPFLL